MAERIYICSHCGNTFLRKAFEQHKFDILAKTCYNIPSLIEEDEEDEEDEIIFIPEKKRR